MIKGNIILIGSSQCGKSVIAKAAANKAGLAAVESEERLRQAAGYGSAELKRRYGVIRWRSELRLIIAKMLQEQGQIMALDIPGEFAELLEAAGDKAFCVLIAADAERIAKRCRSKHKPIDTASLQAQLQAYEQAMLPYCHLRLQVAGMDIEQAADRLLAEYEHYTGSLTNK